MDFNQARFNMVEQQIRTWEVLDQAVLDTVMRIPRERFVPEPYRQLAFCDTRIPLEHGQFMMTPMVEARLVQALNPRKTDRCLEVGTGSGYVTALLCHLSAGVWSRDIYPEFTESAAKKLRSVGLNNATVLTADGIDGDPGQAPFDVIALTGSCATRRPRLEEQLAIGGRMFIVAGQAPVMEALLITRTEATAYAAESLFELELEPLIGAQAQPRFQF